jgi:predicted nucleotidyltransferase
MTVRATVYALGEQPVHFERGTPTEHWTLLEQIRTEPLLVALTKHFAPIGQGVSMNEKFLELLRAFERHGVKAVLIGAYAVAAHGHVRNTRDIDFWVEASTENAQKVFDALEEFKAEGKYSLEKLSKEDNIIHLTGDGWAIDLFTGVRWPKFAPCYERAIKTDFYGVPVKLIALEDLIAMKRFAGRPQDLADVAMLELKQRQDAADHATRDD